MYVYASILIAMEILRLLYCVTFLVVPVWVRSRLIGLAFMAAQTCHDVIDGRQGAS